jgi:tRNA A-37 threonylcarbamoyl transferase component Bud32
MADEGIPLTGGNMARGIVRIGHTVRKPGGPWTPAVHAFLEHLAGAGFPGCPRSLGIDEQGRHVLEWIEGTTTNPYQRTPRSPDLHEIGTLLRAFHDAAAEFMPPAGAVWGTLIPPPATSQVVHHDLAAWNFVHGGDRPVIIDWDLAGPGDPLWDIALSVHGFCGIGDAARGLDDACRDLRTFVAGYGLDEAQRRTLVAMVPVRLRSLFQHLADGAASATSPWLDMWNNGHGEYWRSAEALATRQSPHLLHALLA